MTDLLSDVDAPSDAELISRVRGGDVAAYGELFSRHKDAASRLAKQLVRGPDADDLVSEAFAKVLTVLQGGGGPDVAFRAYLLTAVRRLHVDRVRAGQRLQTTDDMTPFDPGVPFKDTAVAGFETGAAAQAFASLPERWQLVLWHLEVEGQKPADIAPLLGMSANSVSALAYRAREGLRQAFLTMHLSDISETDCRWVNEHLGAFVRKGLSKRDATKVQNHLDECRRCTAMYLELADVNSNLAGIIGPLLLGAAAAGYLASSGAGIGAGSVVSLMSRTKDFVAANSGAVAAGAVATGVAAAAVAAVVVTQAGSGNSPDVVANPPASSTSGLASGASPGASSSTNPSTSGSPSSSAPTPTLSSSASPAATTTASSLPSSLTTPSPGLALLPEVLGTEAATDLPSGGASQTAPGNGSPGGATEQPPGGPTTEPPTTEPPPTGPPPPDLEALSISGDVDLASGNGSVSVRVTGLSTGDQVGVSMQSDHTTFAAPPGDCGLEDSRNVTCTQLGDGGGRTAVMADDPVFTVELPLAFHDLTVPDDITITVTVNGKQIGNPITEPVTPQFDVAMPKVSGPEHSVSGDVDRYDFTATPALPPGVTGLRFHLNGNARFRSSGADPCSVGGDDAKTLSCPDAAGGKSLTLPVAADGLTAPTDVSFDVSAIGISDPSSDNNSSSDPITLAPGAALTLSDLGVLTATPDVNGFVTLQGTLGGVRPGMNGVTYRLSDTQAVFSDSQNPACTVRNDGASLDCSSAASGLVAPVVFVPGDVRHQENPLRLTVTPNAPFVQLGNDNSASTNVSGRTEHDFSLGALELAQNGHNLDGDTDVYRVTGTVGALPDDVDTLDFTIKGASIPEGQADPRCARVDDNTLRCMGLDTDPSPTFTLSETDAKLHDVTLTVLPADPYDESDAADNDAEITVHPGVNLTLASAAGGPVSEVDGAYHSAVRLGGVRDGLPSVFLDLGPGASFTKDPPACTRVSVTRLQCDKPSAGEIPLAVAADDPGHATALSVTATPGGDFEQLASDNVADLTLRAIHDFSIGDLTRTAQSVSGGTDSYTLHTTIGSYPSGVGPLTYAVTGGRFASSQDDCTYVDANHVTCGDGPVDLAVQSTSTDVHDVTVSLQTPAGYDDPDADNDSSSVSVQPGVDLSLADLDPDNESPANDDRLHRVATHLAGVRPGMGSVTYTLTGAATFKGASVGGCAASGKTLVCDDPADGDITFTVEADSLKQPTPITIAVSSPKAFLELDGADNSDSVTLLPRPTYNFAMGALDATAHTVDGDTDHYTIGSTVSAVPTGVSGLGFTVTGGTFAATQDTGCNRTDATHVTCTNLASARRIGFRVDSTSHASHDIGIALTVPEGYDDTNAADNSDTVGVSPGIDLAMGALTPSSPPQSDDGTYTVNSVLTGVRGGAVRFNVTGATVTGSSCTVTSGSVVTCASPSNGQNVSFTLRPDDPNSADQVTIEAQPSAPFTELNPGNNDAGVTLTPSADVVLSSLSVRNDLIAYATVRAQVDGVPDGTSVVRFRISGADAGTGHNQVHFTGGPSGANGQGAIGCYTSTSTGQPAVNGLYATCTGVTRDADGSFFVDMRLAHPHGRTSNVTITVIPVGVDEGGHSANNSRSLTLH